MAHPPANVASSIGVSAGAPGGPAAIALYLTQLVTGLNNWVAQAANAINAGIVQAAPAHSNSRGVAGTIAYDGTHLYVCIATNSWARVVVGGSW
jgi:hypothetical protein